MGTIPHDLSATEPDQADRATGRRMRDHLPIAEARDLLDWLEGQGVRPTEVTTEADGTLTVRWAE